MTEVSKEAINFGGGSLPWEIGQVEVTKSQGRKSGDRWRDPPDEQPCETSLGGVFRGCLGEWITVGGKKRSQKEKKWKEDVEKRAEEKKEEEDERMAERRMADDKMRRLTRAIRAQEEEDKKSERRAQVVEMTEEKMTIEVGEVFIGAVGASDGHVWR